MEGLSRYSALSAGTDGSTVADRVQRATESNGGNFCVGGLQQLVMVPIIRGARTLPPLSESLKIAMESDDKKAKVLAPKATHMGLAVLSNGDMTIYTLVLGQAC